VAVACRGGGADRDSFRALTGSAEEAGRLWEVEGRKKRYGGPTQKKISEKTGRRVAQRLCRSATEEKNKRGHEPGGGVQKGEGRRAKSNRKDKFSGASGNNKKPELGA